MKRIKKVVGLLIIILMVQPLNAQQSKAVLAYYSGRAERLDSFDLTGVSHLIFCFTHLDGSRIKVDNARDTALIHKMVGMKTKYPQMKVLISMGGWGGCETCSDAFFTKKGRKQFAKSVRQLTEFFKADGIDLDWEYPTIRLDNDIDKNPVHKNAPEDKAHFTDLVARLRKTLGAEKVISFAAGGFQTYLTGSVDWTQVMKKVDYVNLMSYDLINGYATVTGHHTALFSNSYQHESTDNAVQYMIKAGVDPKKIILGAAFYARLFQTTGIDSNGLNQAAKFLTGIPYYTFDDSLSSSNGYNMLWDDMAKAPYAFNADRKIFATFDDKRSIAAKTKYVVDQHLGGIMFWELGSDKFSAGLLDEIKSNLK